MKKTCLKETQSAMNIPPSPLLEKGGWGDVVDFQGKWEGKILFFLCVFAVQIFFMSNTSRASFLSMKTILTFTVGEKEVYIKLSVQNLGDEDAHNVKPVIILNNKSFVLNSISKVKQGAPSAWEYSISFREANLRLPGRYTLIVHTHYQDANGYPFSAITASFIDYKVKGLVSGIVAKAEEVRLRGSGRYFIKIKNLDKNDKTIRLTFIFPEEIRVEEGPKEFKLKGGETKKITFKLSNLSGLPKSSYVVYYLMEYDREGKHLSELTPGRIWIKEKHSLAAIILGQKGLIIISIIFLTLFILFQFNLHKRFIRLFNFPR